MTGFTAAQIAALRQPAVRIRRFIWSATRRFSGEPDPIGYWNDVGNIDIAGRTYYGSGTLFAVSGRVTNLNGSVPSLTITLSQISDEVALMARGQDMTNAPLTYSWGIFSLADPNVLIDGLVTRFTGRITAVSILTAKSGAPGSITVTAQGLGHQLAMSTAAVRSDAAQRRRAPADDYARYTGSLKGLEIAFGTAKTVL